MTTSHHTSHSEDVSHTTLNVHYDDDVRSFTTSIASRSSVSTIRSGSTTTEVGQEQIDQIRDAFAVFDKEMTGSITTEQFRSMKNIRITVTSE
ncbi:unnamed protein product [Rotaria sordida]|uniref:EF-hand domain-containing protein n=1 Tax=Rotaria sordida TaxID=392033 RepID=A0A818J9E6_9BILA|nr:unnamed protein product [Rotaria sordida]CAF3540565.1 unnamed protein product [Rotaria sordida]